MPYDSKSETAEEIRQRRGKDDPSPEEIAEMTAALRAARVDENGVVCVDENGVPLFRPRNDNQGDGREPKKYRAGIRVVPADIHRK